MPTHTIFYLLLIIRILEKDKENKVENLDDLEKLEDKRVTYLGLDALQKEIDKNKKELDSSMKRFIKDELFEELHMAIFNKRSLS